LTKNSGIFPTSGNAIKQRYHSRSHWTQQNQKRYTESPFYATSKHEMETKSSKQPKGSITLRNKIQSFPLERDFKTPTELFHTETAE